MQKRGKLIFMLGLCTLLVLGGLQAKDILACQAEKVLLVNKEHHLEADYAPKDLVVPNIPFSFSEMHEKKLVSKSIVEPLEEMFKGAREDGIHLVGVSGYRSYSRQKSIYASNVKRMGQIEADKVSAKAGQSEHQTGLAIDVSAHSVGLRLVQALGETKEGKWLAENAHLYGFIIRYPRNKEHITGYTYEPWHIRYVGKELATYITENHLTLEEVSFCEEYKRKVVPCLTAFHSVREKLNRD